METRDVYHGTNGDNILQILRSGLMKPNAEGKIYFSQNIYDSVFMHGADLKRKLTFAIRVRIEVPDGAKMQRYPTPGVASTLVLQTPHSVPAEVLDLYIRRPKGGQAETIRGAADIKRFLGATPTD